MSRARTTGSGDFMMAAWASAYDMNATCDVSSSIRSRFFPVFFPMKKFVLVVLPL